MSSPAPLDFPTSDLDDAEMQDGSTGRVGQSMPEAPAAQSLFLPGTPSQRGSPRGPLFLAATPSEAGTPSHARFAPSSPAAGLVARRAIGMTPRRTRTPLYAGGRRSWFPMFRLSISHTCLGSSPLPFPSSSPTKKTPRRGRVPDTDAAMDSDPLDFPRLANITIITAIRVSYHNKFKRPITYKEQTG
jgi:DNA replication licensing factor MCM4